MPDLAGSEGFMLYPRGFFGAVAKPAIQKLPRPNDVSRLQPSLSLLGGMRRGDALVANENVERLYAKLISRELSLADFDFRQSVLEAALDAFGTKDFCFWYLQQKNSPSAGELHRDFLLDTLRFIETGERGIVLENWNMLIGYSDHGQLKTSVSEDAAKFFGLSTPGVRREARLEHYDLIQVIQKWVSQPGGFRDLLMTLHILFGAS